MQMSEQQLQRASTLREILDEVLVNIDPEVLARRRARFEEAVDNSIRHVKRSLLDFVDLEMHQMTDPQAREVLELVKRRIHNDVSMSKEQIMAAFVIFNNHGEIPAFGRSQEAMDSAKAGRGNPATLNGDTNGRRGGPRTENR